MEEEPPADYTGGDGPGSPEYCVSIESFLHHPAGDSRDEDTGWTTQQNRPTATGHAGGWTKKPLNQWYFYIENVSLNYNIYSQFKHITYTIA